MSQTTITDEPDELEPENGVYAVITNHADDPHPHVEGVFDNEEDARELHKKCGNVVGGPHPVAWTLFRLAPGEVEQIRP